VGSLSWTRIAMDSVPHLHIGKKDDDQEHGAILGVADMDVADSADGWLVAEGTMAEVY
jgi:hypothetical protein